MVARVTLAEIDVVRRSPQRGIDLFEESIVPALEHEEGYLGCYLFLSQEGKVAVITFWRDDDSARASRLSGFYQEQIDKFTGEFALFKAKPGRDAYDVVVAHVPAGATA
jgi:heme-degrading monooxygenase HmoA